MHELANVLSNQLSVQTGIVTDFEPEGLILVRPVTSTVPVRAHFLRSTQGAPPRLEVGDTVLLAFDADDAFGYVLGVIEPYVKPEEGSRPDVVDVAPPAHADKVRLRGKRISIEAGDEIQLTCGGGTIRIDKRGKIVVRGTEVVSRARRTNKIKGASVAIN